MIVYEDYASNAEKRKAQRGAKRGKPTGKARGFIFTFPENGVSSVGNVDAVASVSDVQPGGSIPEPGLASTGVSVEYLRERCRRVGLKYLPDDWRKRGVYYKTPEKPANRC